MRAQLDLAWGERLVERYASVPRPATGRRRIAPIPVVGRREVAITGVRASAVRLLFDVSVTTAALAPATVQVCSRAGWTDWPCFDQPTALRRLFRSPGKSGVLANRKHEPALVALLKEEGGELLRRRLDEAEKDLLLLPGSGRMAQRLSLVRLLADDARGRGIERGRWGEDRALDRLRLRVLVRTRRSKQAPRVGWDSFLPWAGQALQQVDLAGLPAPALRATAAALASSVGVREAARRLSRIEVAPECSPSRARFDTLSILTLRAVVEGSVSAHEVDRLLPPHDIATRNRESAWAAALLAWHLLRDQPAGAAFIRLTAALVSRPDPQLLRRPLRHVCPWPVAWGGPMPTAFANTLAGVLGDACAAQAALLDDGLALAATFLLFGMAPSALATLGATWTPPPLAAAGEAIGAAARRPGDATPGKAFLTALSAPERDFADLVEQVRGLPEPNLALGCPYWLLGSARGEIQGRLARAGHVRLFRDLRALLDHPTLPKRLQPFWLLRSKGDTVSLLGLSRWLAERVPAPSDAQWLHYAERQARAMWPEWRQTA